MASLLVIGGSGFIGKSILSLFDSGGLEKWSVDRVIALSRNADQLKKTAPQLISNRVELISADIGMLESIPRTEYVINAAASADLDSYGSQNASIAYNALNGIRNYCTMARKFHGDSKIVYVSSGAVYGAKSQQKKHIEECEPLGTLDGFSEAKRQYALVKREAENEIKLLCEHGLRLNIARCFAFLGPWLPRNKNFAIGNFIEDGLAKRPIKVKAGKHVFRSYMDADDLVVWLMTMAENADNSGQVFNIGSDIEISVRKVAESVAHEFGVECTTDDYVIDELDWYVPSTRKARMDLGLKMEFDFNTSLKNTIEKILIMKSRK